MSRLISAINTNRWQMNTGILATELVGYRLAITGASKPGFSSYYYDPATSNQGGKEGNQSPSLNQSPEDMINSYAGRLRALATANCKHATKDALSFWALKLPAIISSAGTAICAFFHQEIVILVAGSIAGICITIDGIYPRGHLRNVHLGAFHDLTALADGIEYNWIARDPAADDRTSATVIIRNAQKERKRIVSYLRDAETSLIGRGSHFVS
jgi:hypothetical protein